MSSAQDNESSPPERAPGLPLRVLVVDDEPTTLKAFGRVIEREGWESLAASNLAEAEAIVDSCTPDVVFIDVYLGSESGIEFARRLRLRLPDVGIVVISSDTTDKLAKMALETGADDFVAKPISPNALALAARKARELRQSRERVMDLERQLRSRAGENVFPDIVTHSDAMFSVLKVIEKAAVRDLAVLLLGESGTGKELAARAIHDASPRSKGRFVELNCAAIPPNLVESELFGHEKGAFTGALASRRGKIEEASGGTLFLDEIGELPLEIQPKLLRALQEKRVTRVGGRDLIQCDFRLVTATHRDLVEEVRAGRFREDLFYRVAVFPIKLPPLRERPQDLELLLSHFLREENADPPGLSKGALKMLHRYPWPGNVRELKNFAQAIAVLTDGGMIDEDAVRSYFGRRLEWAELGPGRPIADYPGGSRPIIAGMAPPDPVTPLPMSLGAPPIRRLDELEREEIHRALAHYGGNVPEAARALGMGRATLYKYVKRHDIDVNAYAQPVAR